LRQPAIADGPQRIFFWTIWPEVITAEMAIKARMVCRAAAAASVGAVQPCKSLFFWTKPM
jgi:hypothetical protein